MTIEHALYELLHDYTTVVVPGLGAFKRRDRGAYVNVITSQFDKPTATISFNAQQRDDDGLLRHYMMEQDGLSEE